MITIYVVDDSATARQWMAGILHDHHVIQLDGKEQLDRMIDSQGFPTAIVSDVMMDGPQGYEIARERSARVPVILVSAVGPGTQESRERRDQARVLKVAFVAKENAERDLAGLVKGAVRKGTRHVRGYTGDTTAR